MGEDPDTAEDSTHVLCVLSLEQRTEYERELTEMQHLGIPFRFTEDPDEGLAAVDGDWPALILVGSSVGMMDGIEFLAQLMRRHPEFDRRIIVLPAKDDPFPAVVQRRDPVTGRSTTDQIDSEKVTPLVCEVVAAVRSDAPERPSRPTPQSGVVAPKAAPLPETEARRLKENAEVMRSAFAAEVTDGDSADEPAPDEPPTTKPSPPGGQRRGPDRMAGARIEPTARTKAGLYGAAKPDTPPPKAGASEPVAPEPAAPQPAGVKLTPPKPAAKLTPPKAAWPAPKPKPADAPPSKSAASDERQPPRPAPPKPAPPKPLAAKPSAPEPVDAGSPLGGTELDASAPSATTELATSPSEPPARPPPASVDRLPQPVDPHAATVASADSVSDLSAPPAAAPAAASAAAAWPVSKPATPIAAPSMTDRAKQPKVLIGIGVAMLVLFVACGSCFVCSPGDDAEPDPTSETGPSETD